jgi:hypothetical protein
MTLLSLDVIAEIVDEPSRKSHTEDCCTGSMHLRSPRLSRKSTSPVRSLRPVLDARERIRQGIFVFDPLSVHTRKKQEHFHPLNPFIEVDADSFSDNDYYGGSPSLTTTTTASRKRRDRKDRSKSSRRDRTRQPRRSPSPSVSKVDPGPGTKHTPDDYTAAGPHPNPHRYTLFEALLKRRKVIPLPGRPGAPIDISFYPGCALLTDEEFEVCCVLRLTPQQYFASRKTLVENHRKFGFYRKSAAQKMLKIDVNKTGKLYDFFQQHHWLPLDEFDTNYYDPENVLVS